MKLSLGDRCRGMAAYYAYRAVRRRSGYFLSSESLVHYMVLVFFVRRLSRGGCPTVYKRALAHFIWKLTPVEPKSPGTWRRQFSTLCLLAVRDLSWETAQYLFGELVDATFLATRGNLDFRSKELDLYIHCRTLRGSDPSIRETA